MFEAEWWAFEDILDKVVNVACYVINRSDGKVAVKVWTSNEVDYVGLRVFKYPTYVYISSDQGSILDLKLKKYIFWLCERCKRVQVLGYRDKEDSEHMKH